MLHRVRLMFLTAVLVLFASFPSIAAPNDGAHETFDASLSFNVLGIESARSTTTRASRSCHATAAASHRTNAPVSANANLRQSPA